MKKLWSIIRYILVFVFVTPFHLLSPLVVVGYWIDKIPIIRYLVWILMDYTRFDKSKPSGYSNDYWVYIQDRGKTKETWLIAIEWHIKRNRVWNLHELFAVPKTEMTVGNQDIHVTQFVVDNLYKNNEDKTRVIQDGLYVATAGLKYIPKRPEDDIWQVNNGEIISIKTSVLGTGFIWYRIGKWYSFRYSQCKEVKYPFLKPYYRTLRFGTNAKRYSFTIKHQAVKKWQ